MRKIKRIDPEGDFQRITENRREDAEDNITEDKEHGSK